MVGGTLRRFLVAAPTGAATAILVSMHGSTSTPERQVRLSRMAALTEQGAVVAFPPYDGGHTARWDESVLDAASAWALANGHPPEPDRTEVMPSLTRLSYGPRDDPGAVTLWVCRGAGHTWPGTRLTIGLRLFLGKVSFDVDATAEIWRTLGVT
jgi:poly(3-hydroxybutyrate) depolymerase